LSILQKNYPLLVQGITGKEGSFQAKLMKSYGTNILAGVTPGKKGTFVEGIPVYNSIKSAMSEHPTIKASIVFVPPLFCFDAVLEAIVAGLEWIFVITEGIPVKDMLWLYHYSRYEGSSIVGPNSPGLIVPGISKVGIIPGNAFVPGDIGVISRSGTLTYEVGNAMKNQGLGVSAAVGIGGDPIVGTTILDMARLFEADYRTKAIVLLGEIGGNMEEEFASGIETGAITKPVVAYIAGVVAPPGKKMGHAGAILEQGDSTAIEKLSRLDAAGANIVATPWEIPNKLKKLNLTK